MKNITGLKSKTLIVDKLVGRKPGKRGGQVTTWWETHCERCGAIGEHSINNLVSGKAGCLKCRRKINHLTHGESYTDLYRLWARIKHGGDACKEWGDYVTFKRNLPPLPNHKSTLIKIDKSLPYQPNNVEWATKDDRNKKKIVEFVKKAKEVGMFANQTEQQLIERFQKVSRQRLYELMKRVK